MHKGTKNGADDFAVCEPSYTTALDYYYQHGFHLIALGDCEELWENSLSGIKHAQAASFEKEKMFVPLNAFIKIFGNHDLHWQNDPLASFQLKELYGYDVPIYEGLLLQTITNNKAVNIFCTHGHQGDAMSDGNWFSKFFVSKIWAPFQSYLKINPNTPAYNDHLKSAHNTLMYEWSAQQPGLLLVTGHTHQPVFESLTHIERLYRQLQFATQQNDAGMIGTLEKEISRLKRKYSHVPEDYLKLKPCYFNSGCCCFDNGGITGIEISNGVLRLIEWKGKGGAPERIILEETPIDELVQALESV
jgi:predicted phosphodiesterase